MLYQTATPSSRPVELPKVPPVSQPDRLLAVQMLRAGAALSVAVHHIQYDAEGLAQRFAVPFQRSDALPWMAGVDVFFVISGFIMVHASRGLFGAPGAPMLFLSRRIVRIVPLYWLATSLFLAASLILPAAINSTPPGWLEIAASYLFWPFMRADGALQPVYSLGWTLNYEMFFYALFALALVLRRELAVLAVCAALVTLVLVGIVLDNWLAGEAPTALVFWSRPIVLEFALGMMLALAREHGLRLSGPLRWSLAIAALVMLHLDPLAGSGNRFAGLVGYGLPALMLVAACALGHGGEGGSTLMTRFGARLGDASYALYLLHPFVSRALKEIALRLPLPADAAVPVFLVLALCGSLMVAMIVYVVFERPMTRRLRGILRA